MIIKCIKAIVALHLLGLILLVSIFLATLTYHVYGIDDTEIVPTQVIRVTQGYELKIDTITLMLPKNSRVWDSRYIGATRVTPFPLINYVVTDFTGKEGEHYYITRPSRSLSRGEQKTMANDE